MQQEISAINPVTRVSQSPVSNENNSDFPDVFVGLSDYVNGAASTGGLFASRRAEIAQLSQLDGDNLDIVPIRLSEISKKAAQVDYHVAFFMTLSTKLVDLAKKLVFAS